MGAITLARLPEFFERWNVPFTVEPDWLSVGRRSGGFDAMRGVQVHHSASATNAKLASTIAYCQRNAADAPVGNGTVTRTKDGPRIAMWAGLAANTAGKGGPRLSSRGLIPLDAANAITVALEAENNGVGEPWPDDMCDLYVRAAAAIIDWANACTPGVPLGPGDVFAHFEWAPGRKIDPSGPSRFNGGTNAKWDMDRFRGEVFMLMVAGPGGVVPWPGADPVNAPSYTVKAGDGWWAVSRALGVSMAELQAFNGAGAGTVLQPGQVILSPVNTLPPPQQAYEPLCALPPPMGLGATGPDVVLLQRFLASNGWYQAALDGQYGPLTQQGVQRFQRYINSVGGDAGPVDGLFGERTRTAGCPLT